MMLTIVAATAVVAAAAGYLAARRRPSVETRGASVDAVKPSSGKPSAAKPATGKPSAGKASAAPAEASPFAGMPLGLGDVVLAEAEERWLAGALVAREGSRVVGALFLAPEGAVTRAVAAFPSPRRDILWLAPTEVSSPSEPPATIEIDSLMLTRRGRLPVTIERLGQGAPHIGDTAIWATYDGGGREVALLIVAPGKVYAWLGRRLDESDYDRLGSAGTE